MEPSKEAIAVRITRLNRQILGKVTSGSKFIKKTIDREALLDALTVLYNECNEDPIKKNDELVRAFVDRYRSTLAELRRARVCISDFEIIQTIGRGHFGEVHMVREKQTCDVYALKVLRKELARKRAAGAAEDERDVLAIANSAWVPKLQYAFQDTNSLYLVMELCSGGDLAGLLSRRNHPLDEQDAGFYVAEVAHALKSLHAMGYVHRDVKPNNILLDRCGHVKLGDFGSCARLSSEEAGACPVGTADYVAPELLAALDCAQRHSVCSHVCQGIVTTALSACDYWSLGVVAFELVTLKRPFSTTDDDTMSQILANIQKYERDPKSEPPFEPLPYGPSAAWRALVAGLLRVNAARRYNYLDTLQHAALAHHNTHAIRDQAPPWVPSLRGAEDASCFMDAPRVTPPPSAAPFRTRDPFAGQLPFIGYSFVAPEESEEHHTSSFSTSHDCTAIDMATFKSAEKLATIRGREVGNLQSKVASLEAALGAMSERARRAETDAERQRARSQADITALTLINKRLERQVDVEKEEHMALERTIQELKNGIMERNNAEVRSARAAVESVEADREMLKADIARLQARVNELQADAARARADADHAQMQQRHYKDTIAKERALRRQTLTGGEVESRETGAKLAAAEAQSAKETRARELAEKKLQQTEADNHRFRAEIDEARRELALIQESFGENQRIAVTSKDQLAEVQLQLTQEKIRASTLLTQVQELERSVEEAHRREAALEEQCHRTEARLKERLDAAEARATSALQDDTRHREKVSTLEQLVRQLEREVGSLEKRVCLSCEEREKHAHSDTESVDGVNTNTHTHTQAQVSLLKEQLERAEVQLLARAEEIAALKQEARSANLARWRKEREFTDLQSETKTTSRDLKRAEERLSAALETKKTAEKKAVELQSALDTLKPQHERLTREAERTKDKLETIQKTHDKLQAEVDRSRNDIRKLKSELQYSEKRRMHAEQQEELSSRERASIRDELTLLQHQHQQTALNNKALQEACSLLEEQLTDLEKLADINEVKSKDLEDERARLRSELSMCRARLDQAERAANERAASTQLLRTECDEAKDRARDANGTIRELTERLEARTIRVSELENQVTQLESQLCAKELALSGAARQLQELHEESASLRTRLHHHRADAAQLQELLASANEQIAEAQEDASAAAAWWRGRETKADATLRQQAKLIDFLQAKVEEAGRKKCSLSNKLFGRSGRRANTSPPLARANRELRDEIDRLRAKLASQNSLDSYPPTTPRKERSKPVFKNLECIDTPDAKEDNKKVQIVWSDGSREKMRTRLSNDKLVLTSPAGIELKATVLADTVPNVPTNEANRSIAIRVENSNKGSEAALVCSDISSLALPTPRPVGWTPKLLIKLRVEPLAALFIDLQAVAIGCTEGLQSLRGGVQLRPASSNVSGITANLSRALLLASGAIWHAPMRALNSALRRASTLQPVLELKQLILPDSQPHLIKVMTGESSDDRVVVACGRRVFLLKWDAASSEYRVSRSLTVDRAPDSLLLTHNTLYIAGEKPLKVNLPSGVLESFGNDATVSAAARRKSPPRAIFLIKEKPVEILICYSECGVFLDETGRRTRCDDPKWNTSVNSLEFVYPFLYVCSSDQITIIYISDEAYKAPPCTCDSEPPSSATSNASDYIPPTFTYKASELAILGPAPNGVMIRSRNGDKYEVSYLDGLAAFRSVGASVESLETVSDSRGSSVDLAHATPYEDQQQNDSPEETSVESIDATGFLADIRKRARQIKKKNMSEQTRDDVIKQILTTEIGLKRQSNGRKSPVTTSEFDSDSDSEDNTESKNTADMCAEMFTRQVRFQ